MGIFGRDDDTARIERQKELDRQQQRKLNAHSTSHKSNRQQQESGGMFSVEYLDKLLEDDHHIQSETLEKLSILLNKNWSISNLSDANIEETKWLRRAIKKQLFAMHPLPQSPIQGEYRSYLFDDPRDKLEALTQIEKMEIKQLLLTLEVMTTRSKDGWQQDQLSKSISVSEYRDSQPDRESGGLFPF